MLFNRYPSHIIISCLALSFIFGGCWKRNADMGHQGHIMFKAVGDYLHTSGLDQEDLCVGCPLVLKMSDRRHGNTSLNGVDVSVSPADAAEVVEIGGGQIVVTALKPVRFHLEVHEQGDLIDSLALRAAEISFVTYEDARLYTKYTANDTLFTQSKAVDLDDLISMGTNQKLYFTLVPRDSEGRALIGTLDPAFLPSQKDTLSFDFSLPILWGNANEVRVETHGQKPKALSVEIVEALSGQSRTIEVEVLGKLVLLK